MCAAHAPNIICMKDECGGDPAGQPERKREMRGRTLEGIKEEMEAASRANVRQTIVASRADRYTFAKLASSANVLQSPILPLVGKHPKPFERILRLY